MSRALAEVLDELADAEAALAECSAPDGGPLYGLHWWEHVYTFVQELRAERDEIEQEAKRCLIVS